MRSRRLAIVIGALLVLGHTTACAQGDAAVPGNLLDYQDGIHDVPTGVEDDLVHHSRRTGLTLEQNAPNPFARQSVIRYQLPRAGRVCLRVYNLAGQAVRTLVNRVRIPGSYSVTWDGAGEAGKRVPTGVYFYRLDAAGASEVRTMVLIE